MAKLLKLISKGSQEKTGLAVTLAGSNIEIIYRSKKFSFPAHLYQEALRSKAVLNKNGCLSITEAGKEIIQKLLHPELHMSLPEGQDEGQNNRQDKCAVSAAVPVKNLSESPLARLYFRKDKNGGSYITSNEFEAGEKLRSDFEKANLQPSVTASWGEIRSRNKNSGSGNQHANLTDFAIDNRRLVERAIQALGPELSGVSLDVCCFLKGLERVEHERRWPPRSAKLMLKTALAVLARHYGFSKINTRPSGKIEHWGERDYRPKIKV